LDGEGDSVPGREGESERKEEKEEGKEGALKDLNVLQGDGKIYTNHGL